MDESKTQQPQQNKQELVVYHLVSRQFELQNIYALGGARSNAKHIASQYGCQLEFRRSQFRDNPQSCLLAREQYGIDDHGTCLSAVLIGEDREKLAKARDDIQRTFGVSSFTEGTINVGLEKTLF